MTISYSLRVLTDTSAMKEATLKLKKPLKPKGIPIELTVLVIDSDLFDQTYYEALEGCMAPAFWEANIFYTDELLLTSHSKVIAFIDSNGGIVKRKPLQHDSVII